MGSHTQKVGAGLPLIYSQPGLPRTSLSQKSRKQVWWYTSVILALWKQKQEDLCEFGIARATQGEPVLKQSKPHNQAKQQKESPQLHTD